MTKVLIFIFFLNPRWRRCVSVILLETGYLFFMRKIFNFRCLWIIGIIFDLQTMNLIFRVTFLLENINMYHYQYLIKITTNNNQRENCIGFKKNNDASYSDNDLIIKKQHKQNYFCGTLVVDQVINENKLFCVLNKHIAHFCEFELQFAAFGISKIYDYVTCI